MRPYPFYFALLLCCCKGIGQQKVNNHACNCNKIGFDSIWADTNKVSCYLIPVERNFVKPRNKTYFLAVATVPALSISPREPLLYLHGGPGIATLSNLTRYLKSRTFSLLRQDHTLIFFDYRGTGFSEPALCKSLGDSLQAISDTIPLKERTTKETSLYSNCKSALLKQDILLSDFSSLQSASDAEMIRKGLGLETVVIYSVSHGTTVALNMMRNFPEHIASVILDSPFPPNAPWLDFIHPFDTCFKVLEQKINENPKYSRLFPSIRDDFITIANRLRKSPIKIPVNKKETVTLYYSFRNYEFAWSVWSAMLNPSYIRLVPLALKEMASGNDSVLIRWAMLFHDPNSFGEYSPAQSKAILGYETKPRFEEETENYLLNEFPDFSHFIAPGLDSTISTVFRPEDPSKEYFDAVRSNIPTLIISGEFDPVCPPLFAGITSKTLPNSTVMIVPSASHAAFFADECTRSVGAMFYLHPENKINLECLVKRKQIEFVTSGILSELD